MHSLTSGVHHQSSLCLRDEGRLFAYTFVNWFTQTREQELTSMEIFTVINDFASLNLITLLLNCKLNIQILQGNAATDLRQGDRFYHKKTSCGAGHNKPRPLANATDLLTPVLCCHLANDTDSELWPVITNWPSTRRPVYPNWPKI